MAINYISGDVREQPFDAKLRIIPHVCNDEGKMGAGVAKALYTKWPKVKDNYLRKVTEETSWSNLGQTQLVRVSKDTFVANMIAQHGVMVDYKSSIAVGKDGKPPLRYAKLASAMEQVADLIKSLPPAFCVIHCPKFGCDLAGGNWDFVETLISEIWEPVVDVLVCVK